MDQMNVIKICKLNNSIHFRGVLSLALPSMCHKESIFFSPSPFFSKPRIQVCECDKTGNAVVTCFRALKWRDSFVYLGNGVLVPTVHLVPFWVLRGRARSKASKEFSLIVR